MWPPCAPRSPGSSRSTRWRQGAGSRSRSQRSAGPRPTWWSPRDEAGLATVAAALHARLGEAVGVGGLAADASGLRTSIVEARHACRFARLRRDAGWATHHQVGTHSLLLALQDEDVLAAFRRALL